MHFIWLSSEVRVAYVVKVWELNLHGGRERNGSGFDRHRDHLGVQHSVVSVRRKRKESKRKWEGDKGKAALELQPEHCYPDFNQISSATSYIRMCNTTLQNIQTHSTLIRLWTHTHSTTQTVCDWYIISQGECFCQLVSHSEHHMITFRMITIEITSKKINAQGQDKGTKRKLLLKKRTTD